MMLAVADKELAEQGVPEALAGAVLKTRRQHGKLCASHT